jgi:hypothetical protein
MPGLFLSNRISLVGREMDVEVLPLCIEENIEKLRCQVK